MLKPEPTPEELRDMMRVALETMSEDDRKTFVQAFREVTEAANELEKNPDDEVARAKFRDTLDSFYMENGLALQKRRRSGSEAVN